MPSLSDIIRADSSEPEGGPGESPNQSIVMDGYTFNLATSGQINEHHSVGRARDELLNTEPWTQSLTDRLQHTARFREMMDNAEAIIDPMETVANDRVYVGNGMAYERPAQQIDNESYDELLHRINIHNETIVRLRIDLNAAIDSINNRIMFIEEKYNDILMNAGLL